MKLLILRKEYRDKKRTPVNVPVDATSMDLYVEKCKVFNSTLTTSCHHGI